MDTSQYWPITASRTGAQRVREGLALQLKPHRRDSKNPPGRLLRKAAQSPLEETSQVTSRRNLSGYLSKKPLRLPLEDLPGRTSLGHRPSEWNHAPRPWHDQITIISETGLGRNRRGRRSYPMGPPRTPSDSVCAKQNQEH